ncbi:hypothetical protein [Actinomadura sp. 3N407]|uniref:hypothetical protein n=1 Tax=Actinomadura sp. 3N407 TaxID=3457423 RepID=UPI003FCC57F1
MSAPARRTSRTELAGLAILCVAIAAFAVRRSLVASTPSSSSAEDDGSTGRQTALGEGDGVIPDVGGGCPPMFADPAEDPRTRP